MDNKYGLNRFHIDVRCEYEVYDDEWADLLVALNHFLSTYKDGNYHNVGAYLEDVEDN